MDIKQIKECIKADNYEMSQHALERALERDIWKADIEHVIIHGENTKGENRCKRNVNFVAGL